MPAAEAISKELLPVHDRPIIEHVVNESITADSTETILVTRNDKGRSRIALISGMRFSTAMAALKSENKL